VTKAQLVHQLKEIKELYGADVEAAHSLADDALIKYINSSEVKDAYDKIVRWYA
jgi:hypothetical protein